MKLSNIYEAVERAGDIQYYDAEIKKLLSQPFDIPASYANIYNKVNRKANITSDGMNQWLLTELNKQFAGSISTNPDEHKFNVSPDLVRAIVPGDISTAQHVYKSANNKLRIFYYSMIKNDPAGAEREQERQVQENLNLFIGAINEDRDPDTKFYRAKYYNILLTRQLIQNLLEGFADAYKNLELKGAAYESIPRQQWGTQLYKELGDSNKTIQQVVADIPQDLKDILKKRIEDTSKAMKFINYLGELQRYMGNDRFDTFRTLILSS